MKDIFKIFLAQILTLALLLVIIAVVGQIYTFSKPGYEILDVIPDQQIGWRLVPDSLFTYTGMHWYEREFKTQIKTNSLGFRDKERTIKKQKDLARLVVAGDSFVMAREVSFAKTPSQLLERYLNESNPAKLAIKQKYEVLNFGITGFGIPQSLLTNRIYVKNFAPEHVFLFIYEDTFWRALSISHAITNTMNKNKELHIRPIFKMDHKQLQGLLQILNFKEFYQFLAQLKKNKLKSEKSDLISEKKYVDFIEQQRSLVTRDKITKISEKLKTMEVRSFGPDDYDKFVTIQNQVINSKFNGQRARQREQKLFILDLWSKVLSSFQILRRTFQPELKMQDEMEILLKIYSPRKPNNLFEGSQDFPNWEKTIFINLKAIEIMNRDVESYGGNLVIVDGISNRKGRLPANLLSTMLKYYCIENKIGYIPLYKDLKIANLNGKKTDWSYDGHFNELGTQIFAESMYRWLQDNKANRSIIN